MGDVGFYYFGPSTKFKAVQKYLHKFRVQKLSQPTVKDSAVYVAWGDDAFDRLSTSSVHHDMPVIFVSDSKNVGSRRLSSVTSLLNKESTAKDWAAAADRAKEKLEELQLGLRGLKEKKELFSQRSEWEKKIEDMAFDRTAHLRQVEAQLKKKNKDIQSLVRFTFELEKSNDIDEALSLFKTELKSLGIAIEPILFYSSDALYSRIAFFQGRQIVRKNLRFHFSFDASNRSVPVSEAMMIANELGRPVGSLYAIALTPKVRGPNEHPKATLYLEFAQDFQELDKHLDFIFYRAHPLSLVIDRILLQNQMRIGSWIWEKAFDHLDDPIALVNVDGEILRRNRSFKSKLEGSVGEELFLSWKDKPPKSSIIIGRYVLNLGVFPIAMSGSGQSTTFIFHFQDVTVEREIRSRLVQNEKMIALGRLAGRIAHEINNPLTGVRSLTQILLQGWDQQSRNYSDLQEIEKAAGRSQKIIKDLLEFTEPSIESDRTSVSLGQLVEKTIPFIKTALRHANVDFVSDEKEDLVNVQSQMVQQVIFNLLQNAAQVTPEKGRIDIEVKKSERGGRHGVLLSIADSGGGVPDEIKDRIFDPFFTTKPKGKGTGLGLCISQSIIEKQGGELFFESVLGIGATFYVWLPNASSI